MITKVKELEDILQNLLICAKGLFLCILMHSGKRVAHVPSEWHTTQVARKRAHKKRRRTCFRKIQPKKLVARGMLLLIGSAGPPLLDPGIV
jgi:hypothetical protein